MIKKILNMKLFYYVFLFIFMISITHPYSIYADTNQNTISETLSDNDKEIMKELNSNDLSFESIKNRMENSKIDIKVKQKEKEKISKKDMLLQSLQNTKDFGIHLIIKNSYYIVILIILCIALVFTRKKKGGVTQNGRKNERKS